MDGNLSAVVQTAKRLALLAEALERRTESAVTTQGNAALALTRTAAAAKADVDNVLRSTRTEIQRATRDAVNQTLIERAEAFDKQVDKSVASLDSAARVVDESVQHARFGMIRNVRVAYAAVAGATAVLGLGGGLLIWAEVASYQRASARATAANIAADIAEAYSRARMTSCGGHPCVKLDKKARRWGDKGQYVLLDLPDDPK